MAPADAAFIGRRPLPQSLRFAPKERSASVVHKLSLVCVWLAIGSSGLVFSEPAPVDALMMGLIVLLPVVGLVRTTPVLVLYLSAWLFVAAGGYISSATIPDIQASVTFTTISLYLSLASFVFAGFVAKRPDAHTRLILNAWTCAALVAACAAIVGYFSVMPGAYDLFTKYGRAAGTFKDPNVFGAFLVAPALYMLHLVINRPLRSAIVPLAIAGILALAILLSFSRGAWVNLAIAVLIFGYLAFVTAPTSGQRARVILLGSAGVAALIAIVAVAAQFDGVSDLLSQRASLSQSYDSGPDGRFGGQAKALKLIAEKPLGIGALTFSTQYHREEVHNVYLSIFLNAGWLGGSVYWLIVAVTAAFGLRHAARKSEMRPLFLVIYAAFLATILEGIIIDTDHWRHFYLLTGMTWGLMAVGRGHCASDISNRRSLDHP
ncbi:MULTISPECIES: O-antigen ligase family protein [Filomicrobium]|uniref:O-antigen ligase like membrane protein n=1 Tax=Filomicrobium insigne TaxID=418854 RepID=A0A1H0QKZ2_9HYPH|nr:MULTISPECIES: O-antigen ligase family protein [Filomicrobium]MCV0369616.1 O-antigen ligase family protein [Filomicrobium sp.]SDP17419.1 O-antigen ligase like membrane protein [Filomicrobium insigne]